MRWLLLGILLLSSAWAQGEEGEEGSAEPEAEPEAESEGEAEGDAEEAPGDGEAAEEDGEGADEDGENEEAAEEDEEGADEDGEEEEECEEVELGDGGDDIESILDPSEKKCKPKAEGGESSEDEPTGSEALAAEVGMESCDKEGMDPKVAECLGGLEAKVGDLMTALMGPDGGGGSLEDQITLVLVKKGVISCENETQCDDNKQCLKQEDGMSRCQNPCERGEIIQCTVPFSECITEEHKPDCFCKEDFLGNGTESCVPKGFNVEANKRGYKFLNESYMEWENATTKCQSLGARLPVLDTKETIDIVKSYLSQADPEELRALEEWDQSSRRVWLGLNFNPGSGLTWADGQRVIAYPASSRLFVWESRRLLSVEVNYADNSRHYGFYIDGDIAKLPGGGRRGAAVLCELLPDQLQEDPNPHSAAMGAPVGPQTGGYPSQPMYPSRSGYPSSRGGYPSNSGYPARSYPRDDDGGYPSYPGFN